MKLPGLGGLGKGNIFAILAGAALGFAGLSMLMKGGMSKKSYAAAYGPYGSADYGYPAQESERFDLHDWGVTRSTEIEPMNNQVPIFSWDVYNPKAGLDSTIPDDIHVIRKDMREPKTSARHKMKQHAMKMRYGRGGDASIPAGDQQGYGGVVNDYGGMQGGYGSSGGTIYSNEGTVVPRAWGGRSTTASAMAKAYLGGQTAFARGNSPLSYPGDPSMNPFLDPSQQVSFPDRITSQMALANQGTMRLANYGMREGASVGYRGEFPSDPKLNPYLNPKFFADRSYYGPKPLGNIDYRAPATYDPSTPDMAGSFDY